MQIRRLPVVLFAVGVLTLVGLSVVNACGGLFCQNVPVDQQAERIIFTINDDETITAYVQINYTGDAPDFSWVVPVPSVPELDVAEMASFDELSTLTAPVFFAPSMPDCAMVPLAASALMDDEMSVEEGGVEVLASGAVGPYNFDVITSPDPQAMISWLRENNYRITPEMEPLIAVYNEEGMVFLAMKLQPDQGAQDIQPIVMTYNGTQPMIPIRLTAVAANPNMTVLTWIFGDAQTIPVNYAYPTIDQENLRGTFFTIDGTNYLNLLDQTVDLYQGRAFVTEYAQPTVALQALAPLDSLVKQLAAEHDYVTRHIARISPEEMTVDPLFRVDSTLEPVSNRYDLSDVDPKVFWQCEGAPEVAVEYNPQVVPPGFQ